MAANKLNDPKTEIFIEHLLSLTQNKKCADCGKNQPVWTALTFGFFICYDCSGQHRRLGPTVSKVKSTTMDVWGVEELRRMYVGGNKLSYKIPDNPDITLKYRDCKDFVAELDQLCIDSARKEPGDSFMNVKRNHQAHSFGNAVIKKKTMSKFSERVNFHRKPSFTETKDVKEKPAPKVTTIKEKKEPEERSTPENDVILARSTKGPINLKNNISTARSPFSFNPSDRDDQDSE